MTKSEFLKKIETDNINTGEYIIVLDRITDEPLVMVCVYGQGLWKIFETAERGGHYIIKEIDNENAAFDYFYELLLSRHKRLSPNS